jgi:hypothetical protein
MTAPEVESAEALAQTKSTAARRAIGFTAES